MAKKLTPKKLNELISQQARRLANYRWEKHRRFKALCARYGKPTRLQAVSRGKVVGTLKGVGFDERSLRRFFRALKKAEA